MSWFFEAQGGVRQLKDAKAVGVEEGVSVRSMISMSGGLVDDLLM
jgi:hypothetical protein